MSVQEGRKSGVAMRSLVAASLFSLVVGAGLGEVLERYDSHPVLAAANAAPAADVKSTVTLPDFASLAKRLGPAVVNVSTTGIRKAAQEGASPFDSDDPMNDLLQRFFGGRIPRGAQRQQKGLGSGFIID